MLLFVHPQIYRRHRRIQAILDWALIAAWIWLTLTALIEPPHRGQAILGLIGATLAYAAILGFIEGWMGVRPPRR